MEKLSTEICVEISGYFHVCKAVFPSNLEWAYETILKVKIRT
jgi:hypothetical protein